MNKDYFEQLAVTIKKSGFKSSDYRSLYMVKGYEYWARRIKYGPVMSISDPLQILPEQNAKNTARLILKEMNKERKKLNKDERWGKTYISFCKINNS